MSDKTYLSIIVPVYNEEDNIDLLCEKLVTVAKSIDKTYEIICINDGSQDASLAKLKTQQQINHNIKVIDFVRNYGQTAAIMAGIDKSVGEVIITIDADLQNDPADIPKILAKLDEGYSVVSGWRKNRKDSPIKRNLISRIANFIISKVSGVKLRDYGCTLKAYRRSITRGVKLYGEMHRFIPIYASWQGAKVTEIPVNHFPRLHGKSNYGLERIFKVILDLILVKFMDKYFTKPIYIFGGFGIFSMALSGLSGIAVIYLKYIGISMIKTPLPLLCVMTFITGFMSLLMGILAEMLVRTYYESQQRNIYLTNDD